MIPAFLKVRVFNDECLRKKSLPVKDVGPAERMLAKAMIETMHQAKGIGLAAPQVGINQRIFVMDIGEGPYVVINPEVLKRSGSAVAEEGCLSIPDITIKVKRPTQISVRYLDENNRYVEKEFENLLARVFLHESDHLNGKLIIDYANIAEKLKYKKKLKELKKINTV